MNEPNEPFEEVLPGRIEKLFPTLFGVEEHLKQFRPRLPQLDIDAIAQVAHREIAPAPPYANNSVSIGMPSRSHLYGAIAASWACGVVVGAACIFFWMSGQKPTDLSSEFTAVEKAEQPVEPESVSVGFKQTGGQELTDVDIQRAINDELQFGWSDEPLKIGMSLRSRGRLVRASKQARSSDKRKPFANHMEAHFELLDIQFTPPAPVTKAELMKELLEDSLQGIH